MNKINDGGPAFPLPDTAHSTPRRGDGMTLRDYFAAKAMQGMLANPGLMNGGKFHEANFVAAYQIADKMLKAREVKP
jgi:hypothetical protein